MNTYKSGEVTNPYFAALIKCMFFAPQVAR